MKMLIFESLQKREKANSFCMQIRAAQRSLQHVLIALFFVSVFSNYVYK